MLSAARLALLVLAPLILVLAGCPKNDEQPEPTTPTTPTTAPANQPAAPADAVAAMKPPLKSIEVSTWRDGGSLGFLVVDSEGKELKFCINRKLNSEHLESLFLGGLHPDHDGATRVESADLEDQLLGVLRSYIESKLSQEQVRTFSRPDLQDDWTMQDREYWHIIKTLKSKNKI